MIILDAVVFWWITGLILLIAVSFIIAYFTGDIGNYQSPAEKRIKAEEERRRAKVAAEKNAEREREWAAIVAESEAYEGKRKYKMLKQTRTIMDGHVLYRIQALRNFADVRAGNKGGYIEREANLSHEGDCWIDVFDNEHNGIVYGNAKVYGNARIRPDAIVCGNAKVYDDAQVMENAKVYGKAIVCGKTKIYSGSKIYGAAKVSGNTTIKNDVKIFGHAKVCNATVYSRATIYGNAEVTDITVGADEFVRGND